eukprot:2343806-Rhodomonas_salina.3
MLRGEVGGDLCDPLEEHGAVKDVVQPNLRTISGKIKSKQPQFPHNFSHQECGCFTAVRIRGQRSKEEQGGCRGADQVGGGRTCVCVLM